MTLQEYHGVSNHPRLDCVFNSLFKITTRRASMLHITGPLFRSLVIMVNNGSSRRCCSQETTRTSKVRYADWCSSECEALILNTSLLFQIGFAQTSLKYIQLMPRISECWGHIFNDRIPYQLKYAAWTSHVLRWTVCLVTRNNGRNGTYIIHKKDRWWINDTFWKTFY